MENLDKLTGYIDALLEIDKFAVDASNNGLQVEGKKDISRVLFSVDASIEIFEIAVEREASMIVVHHGISWGSCLKTITGINAARVGKLFRNRISLYAAHLPLDAHPEIGHNACIANYLELENQMMFAKFAGNEIGVHGNLAEETECSEIGYRMDGFLGSEHAIHGENRKVRKIGIIAGDAGSDGVMEASAMGLDCFITGEVKHSAYHIIKEEGITVIELGHYCSEKPGLLALMYELENEFEIKCDFVDIPTGM